MKLATDLIPNSKILVAVSGGPDSMYLLDNLVKLNQFQIFVAHVNYNKRESAKRDEDITKAYCEKNNIKLFVKQYLVKDEDQSVKNFQTAARIFRYEFFYDVAFENEIEDIFVAHQRNDFVENALMQHRRNKELLFYGISENKMYSKVHQKYFNIRRPLLDTWKNDIYPYLKANQISFGVDETNNDPKYERNAIRKKTNSELYEKHYKWFSKLNSIRENRLLENSKAFSYWTESGYDYDKYLTFEEPARKSCIRQFLIANGYGEVTNSLIYSIKGYLEAKNFYKKGVRIKNNIYLKVNNRKVILIKVQ